jgi:hypothetical protein
MGDYESTVINLKSAGKETRPTSAGLRKKKKDYISKMAIEMGISTDGKTKARLIQDIIDHANR